MTNDIKQDIRQLLSKLVLDGKMTNVGDDTPLRESGIMDSTALLQLVSMVEEKFGVEVSAYDAGENFDCINDIAVLIQNKQPTKA